MRAVATKQKRSQYNKNYYYRNRDSVLKQKHEYYAQNRNKILANKKEKSQTVEEKLRHRAWLRLHREKNVNRRIKDRIGNRIRKELHKIGVIKIDRSSEISGCSIDFLKGYLEARFKEGMTWSNWGKIWHIDHIIPCAEFDLTDSEQQRQCFHYSNLRPLFARDNLSKGIKLIGDHQAELL